MMILPAPAWPAWWPAGEEFSMFFGWQSLFTVALPEGFDNAWQLLPYTLLALAMVVLAMLYTRSFYWIAALFHKLALPPHVQPAIQAGLTGSIRG